MRIGLFVPCYIDQFYPDVAVSTLELLEAVGAEVDFPAAQTCCGQPMANTGCSPQAAPMAERFVEIFSDPSYDYIVCPSGSCTAMVVHHYDEYFSGRQNDQRARRERFERVRDKTLELSQFLYRVAKPESFPHAFPHRVGLHNSCHGLRELRLGSCSERRTHWDNSVRELLSRVPQLQWAELQRSDECCGFGGTFAVAEADVSAAMGRSRIADHAEAGAEVMVAGDMSCLMHLQGLIQRDQRPLHTMHFAQVLAGRPIGINTTSPTTPTQTTR